MAAAPPIPILYSLLLSTVAHYNYTVFPDEHGVPHLLDLNHPDELTVDELAFLEQDVQDVQFKLYTRDGPIKGENLILWEDESITKSHWNSKYPTRFVTHGWRGDETALSCTLVRDAYLNVGDYNVIIIDWGNIAQNLNFFKVARSVKDLSKHVATFLDFMVQRAGMNPHTTKLVGHSLGAHIVSLAARDSLSMMAGIIALDPAKPYFSGLGPGERVDSSDAVHVQIIHTNPGQLGLDEPVGTSDFYPNNKKWQPGCAFDITGGCSHSRSYMYFAESITNPTGFPATSMDVFKTPFIGLIAYMGGPTLDPKARGKYTLKTSNSPPFAIAGR